MKTKKEAFPNFEQDLRDHKKVVEARDNAEVLDEKKKLKEQENAARAIKEAKKAEMQAILDQEADLCSDGNQGSDQEDFW